MSDKQTNLHPKNNSDINLKPNIISDNIPADAVTINQLSETVRSDINKSVKSDETDVTSNGDGQLKDADLAEVNKLYTILGSSNIGYSNYPAGAINGSRQLLLTLRSGYFSGWIYDQYFYSNYRIYHRFKDTTSWSAWEETLSHPLFLVNDSNPTTLVNTIATAIKLNSSIVFIEGNYDLNSITLDHDMLLGNDVHLIGASNSSISYIYTGSDSNIQMNVSPFGKVKNGGGFTIENITIKCKNVRYCVHDEDANNTDVYHNYYRNCFFELDNTENPVWHVSQNIGGGLGINGHIVIENCKFISHGDFARTLGDVSYHNCILANAKSHITVTGCYFTTTFRAGWYGPSTDITEVLLSNNTFAIAPISRAENSDYDVENMKLIQFNNTIRENDSVDLFSRVFKATDRNFHDATVAYFDTNSIYILVPQTLNKVLVLTADGGYYYSGSPIAVSYLDGNFYTFASFYDLSGNVVKPASVDNPIQFVRFAYCSIYKVN